MAKKATKKAPASDDLDFESALKELEALVERMEKGELSLEQSLQDFERGIQLTRRCQHSLQAAEQKVKKLEGQGAQAQLQPFEDEDSL